MAKDEKSPLLLRSESTVTTTDTDYLATENKDGHHSNKQAFPSACCSGRSWHPRCVELATFFYFLAFNGTTPLLEQFVRAVIQQNKQSQLDRLMQYIAAYYPLNKVRRDKRKYNKALLIVFVKVNVMNI